jgi:hypothetical protein
MTFEPPGPPEPPAGSQPAPPPHQPPPYQAPTPPAPPVPPVPPAPPVSSGQDWTGAPPAAPQQWSAPQSPAPAASSSFDPASVSRYDWGILAAGFLAFIFSLFSYYTASYAGISASESAWHGFFGWFAALLALLAAALLAVQIFVPGTSLPVPVRLTVLGGFTVASLCVILAGLIDAENIPSPVSSGRGAGYYLSLIVILAGAVLSFLRMRETGAKLPWEGRG